MGIRFRCQACANKVNVKDFLAGKRGICPKCGARFSIPEQSDPEFLAAGDDPEPEALPVPAAPGAANPTIVVSAPQQPAGLPVAAPIAAATSAGHAPQLNSAQAFAAPQFAPQQPSAQQQPAAPYQSAMPTPGFHTGPAPMSGPRDPFLEAPNAQWYVRHASGQQYGPAPAPTMQKWLTEGRVPGDGMVWREGWADWQVASMVFPQLTAPPVPMARGPVAAPFAPQPGMFPSPAAPAAANNPFAIEVVPTSGTTSPASQFIHQRRDNSKMMLIISIVLLFAIAAVGGVLWYVLTKNNETDEELARHQLLSTPAMTAGILSC